MINLIFAILISLASTFQNKSSTKLEILITDASSDKGMVRVLIFSKEEGFPDQPYQALKSLSIPPKNKTVELTLLDLPPGKYAISVIHDEDNNTKLTTNVVGYPTEKFGFSTNPKVYFSPPSFEKASFYLDSTPKQIRIELR